VTRKKKGKLQRRCRSEQVEGGAGVNRQTQLPKTEMCGVKKNVLWKKRMGPGRKKKTQGGRFLTVGVQPCSPQSKKKGKTTLEAKKPKKCGDARGQKS